MRWRERHPEAWRKDRRRQNDKYFTRLRRQVYETYGGCRCACCGAKELEALTLDHLNGYDQDTDSFGRRSGRHLWALLKKLGFPPGFQVLCRSCNASKANGASCTIDHGKEA